MHNVRSPAAQPVPQERPSWFLARWGFVSSTTTPPTVGTKNNPSNGAIEELILSGAAFGELLIADVPSLLNAVVESRLWAVQPRAFPSSFQSQVSDIL